MAKTATKEKGSAKPATPERVGIHPEHREQAERLVARGKQQGYLTQEDIARGLPDAEAGEIEELLLTFDDNNVEIIEADRGPTWHQVKEEEEQTEEAQREDAVSAVLASDLISVDDPVRMYLKEIGPDRPGLARLAVSARAGIRPEFHPCPSLRARRPA